MSLSEQPINLVLASFSWFLDKKDDGVPPAHWLLVPNVPLEASCVPRRYDLRSRAWPFLLHSTLAEQSKAERGAGGCAILGSSLSAPAPAAEQQQQDTQSSSRAVKPHLLSYHKHICAALTCSRERLHRWAQYIMYAITEINAICKSILVQSIIVYSYSSRMRTREAHSNQRPNLIFQQTT